MVCLRRVDGGITIFSSSVFALYLHSALPCTSGVALVRICLVVWGGFYIFYCFVLGLDFSWATVTKVG